LTNQIFYEYINIPIIFITFYSLDIWLKTMQFVAIKYPVNIMTGTYLKYDSFIPIVKKNNKQAYIRVL
jgi:hypothetical protein